VEWVGRLPPRSVPVPSEVSVPEAGLGRPIGEGKVLEIAGDRVALDGVALEGASTAEKRAKLRESTSALAPAGDAATPVAGSGAPRPALYVAVAPATTVSELRSWLAEVPPSVELRLLLRARPSHGTKATQRANELSAKILVERDPEVRKRVAAEGYREFAACDAVVSAVDSVGGADARSRWPALREALAGSLPRCACGDLDTASLASLIGAEQRAGAATLAYLPLDYVRDERCEATMALRSMAKLVGQIEEFDEQFAGKIEGGAMRFDDVISDDRLRVYFCDALPGETLAAKERARATLYFRPAAGAACEAFQFEPLAPGSPLGTVRRATASRPALAFHYAQVAEELRVYGPLDPATPSLPTDERAYPCDETLKLVSIDPDSIGLESGRWFFTAASCEKSTADADRAGGCFAARVSAP
jgi:hypothetical protein